MPETETVILKGEDGEILKYDNDSETEDGTSTTVKVSSSDRCGEEFGRCRKGYCCSKYGWCGKSSSYCDVEKGCQSEFGKCNSPQTAINEANDSNDKEKEKISYKISDNDRCGEKFGRCRDDYCCSKYGWCGKTGDYCNIEEGCQSEFGKCNPASPGVTDTNESDDEDIPAAIKISTNYRCGEKYGKCRDGYCCSRYGWCGKSEKHCKTEEGCQSEFGICGIKQSNGTTTTTTIIATTTNKASKTSESDSFTDTLNSIKDAIVDVFEGSDDESSDDESSDEKDKEQNKENLPMVGRCGKDYGGGSCGQGYCCSKYGWCGKSSKHCSLDSGCQSEFGECWSKTLKMAPTTTISTDGRCGEKLGKCPTGQCCSKYGWCGTGDDFCDIKKGCNSKYGGCW